HQLLRNLVLMEGRRRPSPAPGGPGAGPPPTRSPLWGSCRACKHSWYSGGPPLRPADPSRFFAGRVRRGLSAARSVRPGALGSRGVNERASSFTRAAYILLAYTVLVIVFGAWVQISGSGAGCGQHWPTC